MADEDEPRSGRIESRTVAPPGPEGRRLHNLRQRTENFGAFADKLRREYGEIVSFELPFMKCCVVFDAELVREVLVTQQPYFRPWFPGDLSNDWKYGSISLHQGEEHRRRAEFMTSVFAGDSEGAYAEIIAEKATVLRERLATGQGVDLVKEFERFAWDAIVEIVLGRGVELPRQLGEDTLTLQKTYLLLDILPGPRLFKSLPLPVLRRGRKSDRRHAAQGGNRGSRARRPPDSQGHAQVAFAKFAKLHRNVVTCIECEPHRRVRYMSNGAGARWHSIYTLTPAREGRTQVEIRLEIRPKNLVGKWLPQLMKAPVQASTEADFKALKRHVESEGA